MRGKGRCRLHGGKSTGPKTLKGVARIRSANTKTGRWSAAGRAIELQRRRWFRNGYRTLRQFEKDGARWSGRPGDEDPWERLRREETEGLPQETLEQWQREAAATVVANDAARLRAMGLLPPVAGFEPSPMTLEESEWNDEEEDRELTRRFRRFKAYMKALGL